LVPERDMKIIKNPVFRNSKNVILTNELSVVSIVVCII